MQLYEVAVAVGVGAPLLYNQFDIGLAPTAFLTATATSNYVNADCDNYLYVYLT